MCSALEVITYWSERRVEQKTLLKEGLLYLSFWFPPEALIALHNLKPENNHIFSLRGVFNHYFSLCLKQFVLAAVFLRLPALQALLFSDWWPVLNVWGPPSNLISASFMLKNYVPPPEAHRSSYWLYGVWVNLPLLCSLMFCDFEQFCVIMHHFDTTKSLCVTDFEDKLPIGSSAFPI